jgi:Ca2+-binding EF-hand superfamily protein
MSISTSIVNNLKEKGLSTQRIEELKAAFDLFDYDRSGRITAEKLGYILNEKFNQAFSNEDLSYMLRQFSDSAEVDFVTFAWSLHQKMSDSRYNEAYGDAFDILDIGKTGELTKDDLQTGLGKLGETLTDAEAEEMLKVAKKKDDFVRAMTNASAGSGGSGGGGAAAATSVASPVATAAAATPVASAGPARPGGAGPRPAGGPRPIASAASAGSDSASPRPARPAGPGGPAGAGRPAGRPPAAPVVAK